MSGRPIILTGLLIISFWAFGPGPVTAAVETSGNVSINPPSAPVVLPPASLTIVKKADATIVPAGKSVVVTLTITNTGANTAINVTAVDNLPVGWHYADPETSAVLKTLGDLTAGNRIKKTYSIAIDDELEPGRYVNKTVVSAANADAVEGLLALDITQPQVLGTADTQLAATGSTASLPVIFLFGSAIALIGLIRLRPIR